MKRFQIEGPVTIKPYVPVKEKVMVTRAKVMIKEEEQARAIAKVERRLPRKIKIAIPEIPVTVGALPPAEYAKAILPEGDPFAKPYEQWTEADIRKIIHTKMWQEIRKRLPAGNPAWTIVLTTGLVEGTFDWEDLTEDEKLMLIGQWLTGAAVGAAALAVFIPGAAAAITSLKSAITGTFGAAATKIWDWLQDPTIGFQIKSFTWNQFQKDPTGFMRSFNKLAVADQLKFLGTLTQKQLLQFQLITQKLPIHEQVSLVQRLWGGLKGAAQGVLTIVNTFMLSYGLTLQTMQTGAFTGFMNEEAFQMIQFAIFAAYEQGLYDEVREALVRLEENRKSMIKDRKYWGTLSPHMVNAYDSVVQAMGTYIMLMKEAVESAEKGDTVKEYKARLKAHLDSVNTFYWTMVNAIDQGDEAMLKTARDRYRQEIMNIEAILNEALPYLTNEEIDLYRAQIEALKIFEEASRNWSAQNPVGVAIGADYYIDIIKDVNYKISQAISKGNRSLYDVMMNEMKKALDALGKYLLEYGTLLDPNTLSAIKDSYGYYLTLYNSYLRQKPY